MDSKKWSSYFINNKIINVKKVLCPDGKIVPFNYDFKMMLNDLLGMNELVSMLNTLVSAEVNKLNELNNASSDIESRSVITIDNISSMSDDVIPITTLLSNMMSIPLITVKKEASITGNKSVIGGKLKFNKNVVIVEDVITDGKGVVDSIKKIINRGGNIIFVVCIIDNQVGGVEYIKYYYPDIKVISCFTINKLINIAGSSSLITCYDLEHIRFYIDTMYNKMICDIRELNVEHKPYPYIVDMYKWWSQNYLQSINPLVYYNRDVDNNNVSLVSKYGSSSGSGSSVDTKHIYINNLILDFRCLNNWDTIKTKLNSLGESVRNIILDFDSIPNWDKDKQGQLLSFQKKYKFNIIEHTHKIYGWYDKLNYGYKLYHIKSCDDMYPRNLTVNSQIVNVIISSIDDLSLLLKDVKALYLNSDHKDLYSSLFLQLHFHPDRIITLLNTPDLWITLRNVIISINELNFLSLNGIIFDYGLFADDIEFKIPNNINLGMCVPVILNIDNSFCLPSSLINNTATIDEYNLYNKFKSISIKLGVSQWIIGGDILQSNLPINNKWDIYSKILRFSNQTDLCCNMIKSVLSCNNYKEYLENILNKDLDLCLENAAIPLEDVETDKEESIEVKELRLKKELNTYNIMINNKVSNIRQSQNIRWITYTSSNAKLNKQNNEIKYEQGIYYNIKKTGIKKCLIYYSKLCYDKIMNSSY